MTTDSSGGGGEASILSAWAFSPKRIWVLAQATFVQLVRMKVFYFLLVFAVLVLVISAIGLLWQPMDHLLAIKRWSFGAMYIFSMVYSIAATALLLPRDLEDRTLYTILSKPVPRLEYLIGRLFGVLILNGISLVIMFTAMSVLVAWKMPAVEQQFVNELLAGASGEAISQEDVDAVRAEARDQGVTLSLFWGLWALYLKASVISAVTLFISTFASSSLFTIVMGSIVTFIGHFHQLAIDYWKFNADAGLLGDLVTRVLVTLFPNLGLFDVIDEVITGSHLATVTALKLTGMGVFYIALFLLLAQILFVDKEL